MKIICGISHEKEVLPLLEAGASDFYAGIQLNDSLSAIGTIGLSRRPDNFSNIETIEQVARIASLLKQKNAGLAITLNVFYDDASLEKAKHIVEQLHDNGVNKLIVADPGLIFWLINNYRDAFQIKASSLMVITNSYSVKFLNSLGITEFTLPRHILISEIRELVESNPDCCFDLFILGQRCLFEDGHCGFQHNTSPNIPFQRTREALSKFLPVKYQIDARAMVTDNYLTHKKGCNLFSGKQDVSVSYRTKGEIANRVYKHITLGAGHSFSRSCGLCFLYYLSRMGVSGLKLPNRTEPTRIKIHQLKMLVDAVNGLENYQDFSDYQKFCQNLYKTYMGRACQKAYCYYR